MKERVVYEVGGGHQIEVEVSAAEGEGATKIARTEEAVRQFTAAMEKVKEVADAAVTNLSKAAPEEIEVSFGIKLGGKTGLIIAEGSAEANLNIKLKFTRKHVIASGTSTPGESS
jgi:hypothetical protein